VEATGRLPTPSPGGGQCALPAASRPQGWCDRARLARGAGPQTPAARSGEATGSLDVVRIDDPAYDVPLIVGSTARDLRLEEFWSGYQHRWPVETNFFVAQDTAAMEMPRAWTQTALERRISLALLVGTLLKAIAAVCKPQAIGPWDRKPVRSAGRLANYLDLHAERFFALALQGVEPRNHRKNPNRACTKDLRPRKAA